MWGCSEVGERRSSRSWVFPTYVGMFRARSCRPCRPSCFPHVCGDVPDIECGEIGKHAFSPRMWGCSGLGALRRPLPHVFPTYVGMFRGRPGTTRAPTGFPHVCGDVPSIRAPSRVPSVFSPRMWGCSLNWLGHLASWMVFPTYVGMFRCRHRRRPWRAGFPHVCGDVPPHASHPSSECAFSPRMWGCSYNRHGQRGRDDVFPTYVGMFRGGALLPGWRGRFPHVCGDVPLPLRRVGDGLPFSPRMWGCSGWLIINPLSAFVFPTYVGMFRP